MKRPNVGAMLVGVCLAMPCLAQSAVVAVTHDDPDGIVLPGETVQITLSMSWQDAGLALYWIEGSILASTNAGAASNNVIPPVMANAGAAVRLEPGVPSGGSVTGVALERGLAWAGGQQPPFPWGNNAGVTLLTYDWTAPASFGQVEFEWAASPVAPLPHMHFVLTPITLSIPTTYVGTSLTVVPAPSVAGLLLASALLTSRRRRAAC